jgi:site-specific DNA recombinase
VTTSVNQLGPFMRPEPECDAVLYLRVSTKEQAKKGGEAEGFSIPAQRDAGYRKAAVLNARIVEEFVDAGESARSADRPDLQRMLEYLAAHPNVKYVIVHKVDRLARNRVDDVEINVAIRAAGAQLVSCTENIDETPSGMLLHGIMSSIAEFYSRNLATEVAKGMNQKVKNGGTPSLAPLGYLNRGVHNAEGREVRTVVVDGSRAAHISWAFDEFATGEWTLRAMQAELDIRGLRTRSTPKRAAKPVGLSMLHDILTNPYYKGIVVYRGVQYDGKHPKLTDELTWQRVQAVLATHLNGEKVREHPHYLKSSVFCGGCGHRYVVTMAKGRRGKVYPYFVCLGRHQKRTPCTRKAVPIPMVERLVEELYQEIRLSLDETQQIREWVDEELRGQREATEALRRRLLVERDKIKAGQQKLLEAHYASAIPLDLLKREQDRFASELAVVEGRLQATVEQSAELNANLGKVLDLASDCHRAYMAAPESVRRQFNQAFFAQILVFEDHVEAELAEPFDVLLSPDVKQAAITTLPDEEIDPEHPVTIEDVLGNARTPGTRCVARGRERVLARVRGREGLKDDVLVREGGLEPPRPKTPEPKSGASTWFRHSRAPAIVGHAAMARLATTLARLSVALAA